jgi:NTP pyrophosphatase (non-canonical NTP hydrolase)
VEHKQISLPKLNNLTPTLESTTLKLLEEAGELAQAIGKFRGMNGEQIKLNHDKVMTMITKELLDVAQTAVTMMYVLEEQYGVNLQAALNEHVEKLKAKNYLV